MRVNNKKTYSNWGSPDFSNDVAGEALDESVVSGVDSEVADYAQQLKNHYGNKYSDVYYIQYAKQRFYVNSLKLTACSFKRRSINPQVPDPKWAKYSYQEILQMADGGNYVPKDVLEWAQGQFANDSVTYIVMEDSQTGSVSDISTATDLTNSSQLVNQVKSYVQACEKAQEKLNDKYLDFQNQAKSAQEVKQKEQQDYEEKFEQIKVSQQEWKDLDNKQKTTKLTLQEQERYNELSDIISSNSDQIKQISSNAQILKLMTSSLDVLDSEISNCSQIISGTILSSEILSKFKFQINDLKIQHKPTIGASGNPNDVFTGASNLQIISTAHIYASNLESSVNDITVSLSQGQNLELIQFARDYESKWSEINDFSANAENDIIQNEQSNNLANEILSGNVNIPEGFGSIPDPIVASDLSKLSDDSALDLSQKDALVANVALNNNKNISQLTQKSKETQKESEKAISDNKTEDNITENLISEFEQDIENVQTAESDESGNESEFLNETLTSAIDSSLEKKNKNADKIDKKLKSLKPNTDEIEILSKDFEEINNALKSRTQNNTQVSKTAINNGKLTENVGVAMLLAPFISVARGFLYILTGKMAQNSGNNGNEISNDADKNIQIYDKALDSDIKEFSEDEKIIAESENNIDDSNVSESVEIPETDVNTSNSEDNNILVETQNPDSEPVENPEQAPEQNLFTISASVVSNSRITSNTNTSDQEDRRIANINKDAQTENQKRQRRVNEVSRSSNGRNRK